MESEKEPSLWPLAFLGVISFFSLLAYLKIKPVDAKADEKYPHSTNAHEEKPLLPVIANTLGTVDPLANQINAKAGRPKIHPYLKFGVAVFTLLAVAWYAWEARKQRIVMDNTFQQVQRQTTLMRQQLVGTVGAVVKLEEPRLIADPTTGKQSLLVALSNQGQVISPESTIAFTVETVSLPDMKQVRVQSYSEIVPQVRKSGWSKQYPLKDEILSREFPAQSKTITVKGTFEFANGFGDRVSGEDFCFSYIGLYNVKTPEGGSSSGGGGFMPCTQFNELVTYLMKHPWK